jgi:hypothetical protein
LTIRHPFGRTVLALVAALATGGEKLSAQDAFVDPVAAELFAVAQQNRAAVDSSIARYAALIQQRIAAAIRTPLKDRIVYRNETAVRAFWDEDYDAVVQVLGTHSQYPGRSIAMREGDLDWLTDLPFDEPFDPGGDRLFFGSPGSNDEDEDDENPEDGSNAEFWIAHPLAPGADSLYRYESGDTLTLSFPDGRQLLTVQLDVVPTVADVHRIMGTLWIEPESGALVRAVYRLSKQFDAIRDIPEMQEEEDAGSFRYVPGLFKPWTFDLTLIAVDYALWEFEVWLPRSMRLEGEAAAGILKFPVSMDVSYQIESVTTRRDLTARLAEQPRLIERHFETRAEAMAFVSGLLSEQDGIAYESAEAEDQFARERRSLMIVPEDRSSVATSPHLPPPIWQDAAGFPSDEDIEAFVGTLADLPAPAVQGIPWAANWGWSRPDLIRYNRVEGPSVGGRFEASIGGPYTLGASGFFGFADLDPKVRLDVERSSVLRRLKIGAYRELRSTNPRGRHLGFGNSVYALLFGRDEGEYFRATGFDFDWRPPAGARESFELRAYAERHEAVASEIDFALFRAFDSGWGFRPNIVADEREEVGAELWLSPWWGSDPFRTQVGLELYGQGARSRPSSGPGETTDYGRASAVLRMAVPVVYPTWRVGVELGGGTSWGDAPLQRSWFLGGASTLRGYPASATFGSSFVRSRVEVARTYDIGTFSLFGDAGWAGVREDFDSGDLLYGVGVGGSILDGLIRLDLSHGLTGPARQFRVDLYLDGLL